MANNIWTKLTFKGASETGKSTIEKVIQEAQGWHPRAWIQIEEIEVKDGDVRLSIMTAWDRGETLVETLAQKLNCSMTGGWNGECDPALGQYSFEPGDSFVSSFSPMELAEDASASADQLLELSNHEEYEVRRAVAANPSCPPDAIESLASDEDQSVQEAIARREDLTLELMKTLCTKTKDWQGNLLYSSAVFALAENPIAPAEILSGLADSENKFLLQKIAKHPNTPAETIDALSNHPDEGVRKAVDSRA
mgnify:CR=1 FL=1